MDPKNVFEEPGDTATNGRFGATPWTDVTLAQQGVSTASRSALERLCSLYWYPVYAHIRQRGFDPHDAEDLTQEFFSLLIEKNYLEAADRRRGRFRSFLLVAVNRFLVNAYHREHALKRGGGLTIVSIDQQAAEHWLGSEADTGLSPDQSFDRRWAQTVLEHTLVRLRSSYAEQGKSDLFEALKEFAGEDTNHRDYTEVAGRLGMSPGAVAVAVHRLRQRYRELLLAEIRSTVANPDHAEAELRHLVSALQS
jgi:RNA polymerase sigma-70 factor (ECF subfamily)